MHELFPLLSLSMPAVTQILVVLGIIVIVIAAAVIFLSPGSGSSLETVGEWVGAVGVVILALGLLLALILWVDGFNLR
jgi:hypothetical protein